MKASTFARKPPGKRGVNKATMNEPQEEFIADQAAVVPEKGPVERMRAPRPASAMPKAGPPRKG
jgi:hypothetical protein